MTKKNPAQTTVNAGPEAARSDENAEFKVAGNVTEKGQDPSPGNRDRGETSDKVS